MYVICNHVGIAELVAKFTKLKQKWNGAKIKIANWLIIRAGHLGFGGL